MSDKVGVGIIGCGGMGSHHARNLSKIEDAHLRGFADVRPEAGEKLRSEVGCDYSTTDPGALLDDDQIDVVLICTHHDLHLPLAIQAAEAGKQIFVEKPLALTIEACEQIEAAVERAGVKLMAGFQARFSPFMAKLKEVIPEPLVIVGQTIQLKAVAMSCRRAVTCSTPCIGLPALNLSPSMPRAAT
jgi:myo-inositol 2-dehydrogenase/D-chiro-inositol 1-dehydrogenase